MKEEIEKNSAVFYEEDEIDLLDVIKPLVKYKLQFLIVLILGLIAVFFWTNRQAATQQASIQQAAIQQVTAQKATAQKENMQAVLLKEILKETKQPAVPFLEVRNLEYVSDKGIRLSFDLNLEQVLEKYRTSKAVQKNIFVNTRELNTSDQYQKLTTLLKELEQLDQDLAELEFEKLVATIQFYLKAQEDATVGTPKAKVAITSREKQQVLNIQKKQQYKGQVIKKIRKIVTQIAQPVWGKVSTTKIPWLVYVMLYDVKSVERFDLQSVQKKIDQLEGMSFIQRDLKRKLKNYLKDNNLEGMVQSIDLPIIKSLVLSHQKVQIIKPQVSKKILILGIVGVFMLAVISVYLRTWIQWLLKSDKDSERWKEFMEALKYWKL